MEEKRYLTFALTKGRLADKTLSLLESIGLTCEEMKDKSSRKLVFVNEGCACRRRAGSFWRQTSLSEGSRWMWVSGAGIILLRNSENIIISPRRNSGKVKIKKK